MRKNTSTPHPESALTEVVVLLAATALVAAFAAMRYGGLWGDSDTSEFSRTIRAMLAAGRLIPTERVYVNGYGFPALATFLVQVTGVSVAQLQIAGGALLTVWVVIPAWLANRELTGSSRAATLATVILLVQPELLFALMRGSHEKFTRGLMFLCLYLLVRSILAREQWRRFAAYLLAFYLAIYALITFNNLMATSFIVALGLALLLSLALRQVAGLQGDDSAATRRRLLYAVGVSLILAFIFTFYAYPPARHGLQVLAGVSDKLALLFLDVEEAATNPYQTISSAWISLPVYLVVSMANWLLLSLSFVLWSAQTLSWARRRTWPSEPRSMLLWSLYGAFGLLGAASIAIDASGAIAGNLQHRLFPSFAMVAAPLLAGWFVRRQASMLGARRLLYGAMAAGVAVLGVIAVAKATNEPSLSNKWQYYTAPEKSAVLWRARQSDLGTLWVGLDERIPAAMRICCPEHLQGLTLDDGGSQSVARDILVSGTIRARAARVGFALPVAGDSLITYTNGEADIFHLRPVTPFQK